MARGALFAGQAALCPVSDILLDFARKEEHVDNV